MKNAACALFIALASFDADAAVALRLWVEPQSQLPAIEPSLRVEAVNTGSESAELPLTVALRQQRFGTCRIAQPAELHRYVPGARRRGSNANQTGDSGPAQKEKSRVSFGTRTIDGAFSSPV